MNLTPLDSGSFTHPEDPGEPTTREPRISVTQDEARLLSWLATGRRVAEIGTGLGVSTRAMARTASSVCTVDIDPWVHENIWPSLPSNVLVFEGLTDEFEFDMVFIDGDHSLEATRRDIDWALSVCPDGLIVCHDSRAVHAAFPGEWNVLDTVHGIGFHWTHRPAQ